MRPHHSTIAGMRRIWVWAILLGCGVTGCGTAVAPAGFARDQPLHGGSVDVSWHDSAARCTVVTTFKRISCRAVIRRLPSGSVRLALLADEGILLADLTCDGTTTTIANAVPDLESTAPRLGWFVHQTWGEPTTSGQPEWRDGHWRMLAPTPMAPGAQRLFGGDPLLLRLIDAPAVSILVGDYRPWSTGLMAYHSELSALGISVTLTLNDPRR